MATAVLARLATTRPSIVYIGAAYPLRPGPGTWSEDWTTGDHIVIDSGLYARDDAHSESVCRTISTADVILLGGGRPGVLYDNLAGTPALEALVAATDHRRTVGRE